MMVIRTLIGRSILLADVGGRLYEAFLFCSWPFIPHSLRVHGTSPVLLDLGRSLVWLHGLPKTGLRKLATTDTGSCNNRNPDTLELHPTQFLGPVHLGWFQAEKQRSKRNRFSILPIVTPKPLTGRKYSQNPAKPSNHDQKFKCSSSFGALGWEQNTRGCRLDVCISAWSKRTIEETPLVTDPPTRSPAMVIRIPYLRRKVEPHESLLSPFLDELCLMVREGHQVFPPIAMDNQDPRWASPCFARYLVPERPGFWGRGHVCFGSLSDQKCARLLQTLPVTPFPSLECWGATCTHLC
ncbi:uncharacterized protein BJX67DRAFT_38119 [Aspergillus lucknowensis]|uniref:Uncharacterized protein n=1 Tax=Aspergillus lucknowensis TaxID=176173 RepID=A0ABR4LW88_9EURO